VLEEKECNKLATDKQEAAIYKDYNVMNMAINDGKYEFLLLKEILLT
jgi:hypothetical protein